MKPDVKIACLVAYVASAISLIVTFIPNTSSFSTSRRCRSRCRWLKESLGALAEPYTLFVLRVCMGHRVGLPGSLLRASHRLPGPSKAARLIPWFPKSRKSPYVPCDFLCQCPEDEVTLATSFDTTRLGSQQK